MFRGYFQMGLDHILDIQGLDHLLFIIAITIAYNFKEWRKILVLVTAFTLGHSLSLFLAGSGILNFNKDLVEWLIPITIIIAAIVNIYNSQRKLAVTHHYLGISIFGLIHGMAFSSYFGSILGKEETIIIPLLAFNLGVEAGQLLIVLATLLSSYVVLNILKINRKWFLILISLGIILFAIKMLLS